MTRLALALLASMLLASCLLAPGKFTSTLTINADRGFTYAYVGEVYGLDMDQMMKDMPGDGDKPASTQPVGWQKTPAKPAPAEPKEDKDAANRAVAEALSKEAGFRKVEYLGNNKFMIDYQIGGKLDHTFLFPYNIDAGIIIPFIAVELRANGTARVKAPGFANDAKAQGAGMEMGGSDAARAASKLDGVFTLDTDAEVVSQNNEDGVKTVGGRTTIAWKATPLSSTAPMAVLRFK
jgi:hypothetical protein